LTQQYQLFPGFQSQADLSQVRLVKLPHDLVWRRRSEVAPNTPNAKIPAIEEGSGIFCGSSGCGSGIGVTGSGNGGATGGGTTGGGTTSNPGGKSETDSDDDCSTCAFTGDAITTLDKRNRIVKIFFIGDTPSLLETVQNVT
jgi:hypothetical protein